MSATEFYLIASFSLNEGQFSIKPGLTSASCRSHSQVLMILFLYVLS